VKTALAEGTIMKTMMRIPIMRRIFFIRTADDEGVFKSSFHFEVKAFMTQKDIDDQDGIMWEKKSSGVFVKKTEKAVRKLADKKTESIEQTADWMKKYQYAEWPKNPDKLEQEMKNKIKTALSEEMLQEPAFLAWVLYQVAGELIRHQEVKAIWE
jgi:hypothetical protein